MDPQLSQIAATLADVVSKLDALTQIVNQADGRLVKLETACQPPTTEEPPLRPYTSRHAPNIAFDPDEKHLKSIKLDVLALDGHLDPRTFFRLASRYGYVFHLVSPFWA